MAYLTYAEYMALNGTNSTIDFERNVGRASAMIDTATHKRVERMADVPDKVKMLCRDLVDLLIISGSEGNVASRSQSAGGVSESETYTTKTETTAEADELIYDYLLWENDDNGIPLLSRSAL